MALFSVVGLSAAWLTVVLWFPLLTRGGSKLPLQSAEKLNALRLGFPRLEKNPSLVVLLIVAVGFSIYTLWGTSNHEDIRLLQTSSAELIAQEQTVQKALGLSSSAQFFLINAQSIEQCLQIEEGLLPVLNALKQEGQLEGYLALASRLPSLDRQDKNVALVNQLYQQQLKPIFQTLNVSDDKISAAQSNFNLNQSTRLTADSWLQAQSSENWRDLIVHQSDNSAATVIRLSGLLGDDAKQAFMSLAEQTSGVDYIDQTKNISELMEKYRAEVINWVSLAYLFVFTVLLLRYKTQVWRIVLPPLLASIFTLALLVQFEQGINLFHLMALILVLGIGLDMGIFLTETGEAAHTWLAVSLSTYTSLLAFGLLALSNTPVLHYFGLTVLLGLSLVWLLVPLMRKNNTETLTP
jgi:predicted exporter